VVNDPVAQKRRASVLQALLRGDFVKGQIMLLRLQFLLALLLPFGPAMATSLPMPEGEVILRINGAITQTNMPEIAAFDMAMLDALEQRQTITETPWYDGPQDFTGPTLATLLSLVGATGQNLRIVAINDYAVTMPVSDTQASPVILASRLAGQPLSVREKGPLFVIYPFSEMPHLKNETMFSRSVWQVISIEVLP
jgi:hypothetical protein